MATGGWEWVDGTPMAYTNWAKNEPNDDDNHCAELWPKSQGKWLDIDCKFNSHYICEKPKSESVQFIGGFRMYFFGGVSKKYTILVHRSD